MRSDAIDEAIGIMARRFLNACWSIGASLAMLLLPYFFVGKDRRSMALELQR